MACVVGVLFCFLLMAMGLPVFVSLGLGAILGLFMLNDLTLLANVSTIAFESGYGWSFVAIPLFVFMGFLVIQSRLGEDMFDTVYKWIGHIKGGLGIASCLFSALFGFACGSGTAGVATIGGVTIPEMMKRNYNLRFALGTLSTTGGLSALIPPSVLMIIYCVFTETSIGKLFIAAILPAMMLAAIICIYILFRSALNPKFAPAGPSTPWKERIKSLTGLIPIVIIFLCVIGGLYYGIWTPIEAGGTGAASALLIGLIKRRLRWSNIKIAGIDTVKVFGMLYMLQITANLMSFLFYASGTSEWIQQATLGLNLPDWGVILLLWLIMFLLGAPLEPPAIMMICTPIFLPIIVDLGYDPVWFGIIMCLACELATISPPVGMSIFVIMRVAPEEATLWDVYVGVTPYMGLISLLVVILIFFPDMVMWLPNTMISG